MQYVHRRCSLTWFLNAEQLTVEPDDHQFRSAGLAILCFSDEDLSARGWLSFYIFSQARGGFKTYNSSWSASQPPEGCVLRVLSVDVIFSASDDLANEENQRKWIHFAVSGCIIACYAGPPCESWSKARSRGGIAGEARGDDNGPRAIRTAAMPRSWSSQRS